MICLVFAFYGGMRFDRFVRNTVDSPSTPVSSQANMNGEAYFYLGRSLLAVGQAEQALDAFRQAELLQPDNPNYVLWQGAAHYALGEMDDERQSYRQLIRKRPDFLPARLNLAHNLLQGGQLIQAEKLYEQVLQRDPEEKTALYNRALVFHLQGKVAAEAEAWKESLRRYRTGVSAYRALEHLHELGDYSYRKCLIGYQAVIFNQELLVGPQEGDWEREVSYLARQVANQSIDVLNIVVFIQDDALQAKQIARNLRVALVNRIPGNKKKSFRISWFGEAESIETANGETVRLPEGVLIFSDPKNYQKKEKRV
jgi:tetratricopeptide (TPR) repeat protein